MPPIHRLLRSAVLAVLLGAILAPTAAQASNTQLSIMMDDDLLVYRDDATRDAAMRNMKTLGVDSVRVTVLWSVLTDEIGGKGKTKKEQARRDANMKRFKKYGEASPKAYPPLQWNRFDGLVRACKTLGMLCYLDLTGPGPSWAHGKPPKKYAKDAKWWKPNPRHFYNFVRAVGTRYSGTYRDENDGRGKLPRVSMWALWNEPNQGGWLRPQYLNGKPVSPALYRELYQFGFRALLRSGHPLYNPATGKGDIILLGETAPINVARKTTTSAMGPKIFINELLCGPGSSGLGCSSFDKDGPLKAYAFAHHPYTKKESPVQRNPDPEAITLANFGELGTQLDDLAAKTGHIVSGMPLISTEFGYETNPPDPYAATTLAQQAQYLELGEFLTATNPRVIGNTQFLLKDVKPNKRFKKGSRNYWGTYQSGLYGSTGTPKPAAKAYAFPFVALRSGTTAEGVPIVSVWGQIRFRANVLSPAAPDQVTLQWRPNATVAWTDVLPIPVTTAFGYFSADGVQVPPGELRIVWSGPQLPFNAETLVQPVP